MVRCTSPTAAKYYGKGERGVRRVKGYDAFATPKPHLFHADRMQ